MFYLPELEQGILRMFSNQALFFIGYSTQHSNSEAEKILRLPAQIVSMPPPKQLENLQKLSSIFKGIYPQSAQKLFAGPYAP